MVRTRFAPSPTGYLHIGGVRTALFNWLFARKHGGQFILRIDDTDQARNVAEALAPILHGFQWLGIDWDEGPTPDGSGSTGPHAPYFQSQRGELYQAAAEKLLASGHAYRDFARPEELQALRQEAEKAKQPFVYDRRWAADSAEDIDRFTAEGRQSVVRMKMPREGFCEFEDLVLGPQKVAWSTEQDHVIQRADGSCLYHLASVVDDAATEITHVIRAQEHLSNTPRQIFIAQSLGYELPAYAHLPVVAEPGSKKKLSKRNLEKYLNNKDFKNIYEHGTAIAERLGLAPSAETFNPVIVDFYEQVGYLPEAIINYLLMLGWSLDDSTEDFTREQMIEAFTLERVVKAPASFDPAKLTAFQGRHMQQVPLKQKAKACLGYLQQAGIVSEPPPCEIGPKVAAIVEAAGDRLRVFGDILSYDDFFTADADIDYEAHAKQFDKRLRAPGAAELLAKFREQLATVEPFTTENLDAALAKFEETEGIQRKEIIHSLRLALTGKPVGFGLFETLAILGRDSSLARIDRALGLV